MNEAIRIAAVGDIVFEGRNRETIGSGVFAQLIPELQTADLAIANLENPLLAGGRPVLHKCTLRGVPAWAQALRNCGFDLVSLANNHVMDYGQEGLFCTINALDKAGILHVGAGRNIAEASRPVFLLINRIRVAVLARSMVVVHSPCYAETSQPGVAAFDKDELIQCVTTCRQRADVVILLLHWGIEDYSYPTPSQCTLARRLLEQGVDMILGHHPHVMQGIETRDRKLVAYSLGNLLFDEFSWQFVDLKGREHPNFSQLREDNRAGGILKALVNKDGVLTHSFVPTRIAPEATIILDSIPKRHAQQHRLDTRLKTPGYAALWRLYSLNREWKLRIRPFLAANLTFDKLAKARPRHFREVAKRLLKSMRITTGKATNPYD